MNILITGACSFIGRQLIAERAVISLLTDWSCVQDEITNEEVLAVICDGSVAVVHCAAF